MWNKFKTLLWIIFMLLLLNAITGNSSNYETYYEPVPTEQGIQYHQIRVSPDDYAPPNLF